MRLQQGVKKLNVEMRFLDEGDFMNRNKFMGIILGLAGLLILVGGLFLAISYLGTLMKGMIDFISANANRISQCGITVPDMFVELRDQFATLILPMLYLGIPVAVIVISVLMFYGGYFFGRGSLQDEMKDKSKKEEEIETEVERRVGTKKKPEKEPEEEEPEEMEEEEPEEEKKPLLRRKTRRR